MQSDPPETSELQAFVRVVEGGSVATAARELGLPRATVSRRLARLEERLGARLLHRTTRKQGLTDAGDELYRHARIILAAVSEAEEALRRHDDVRRAGRTRRRGRRRRGVHSAARQRIARLVDVIGRGRAAYGGGDRGDERRERERARSEHARTIATP